MKNAIKPGVLLGLVGIILTLLIYVASPELMIKWWFGVIMLVISLGLVIYFAIQYRNNECDGFLPFGQALLFSFIALVLGNFISSMFSILLYEVIDPDLPQVLAKATLEQTYEMMKGFGTPEDVLEQTMEQLKTDLPKSFSALGILKNFAITLIPNLFLALIAAAFAKKKQPEAI